MIHVTKSLKNPSCHVTSIVMDTGSEGVKDSQNSAHLDVLPEISPPPPPPPFPPHGSLNPPGLVTQVPFSQCRHQPANTFADSRPW